MWVGSQRACKEEDIMVEIRNIRDIIHINDKVDPKHKLFEYEQGKQYAMSTIYNVNNI